MKKLGALLLFSLACGNASAGPIFSLVGSGGIAPLHPEGDDNQDRMVISSHFGISATGGGFMNGTLTLVDGFELPTVIGGTTTIQASDIEQLSFVHNVAALTPSISPIFGFNASAADILAASGTIVFDGSEYRFTPASVTGNLHIETSLATAWSVPVYGNVTGNWTISGSSILVGSSGLALTPNSQASGGWELTGYSTVPEPSGAFLLMGGLALMLSRRTAKVFNREDY